MNEELLIAAEENDLRKLEEAIRKGADLAYQNRARETAFTIALKKRHQSIIEYFVDYFAKNLGVFARVRENTLKAIVDLCKDNSVKSLFIRKIPDTRPEFDKLIMIAFDNAIRRTDELSLKRVLMMKPSLIYSRFIDAKHKDSPTLMLYAMRHGETGTIKATVWTADGPYERGGTVAILDFLLRNGLSKITETTDKGDTILTIAFENQDDRLIRYLFEQSYFTFEDLDKDGHHPLEQAILKHKNHAISSLISLWPIVDLPPKSKISMAEFIAKLSSESPYGGGFEQWSRANKILQCYSKPPGCYKPSYACGGILDLHEFGTMNIRRAEDGNTIMHLELIRGERYELVFSLIDNGALLNIKNKAGKTAMDLIHESRHKNSSLLFCAYLNEMTRLVSEIDVIKERMKLMEGEKVDMEYIVGMQELFFAKITTKEDDKSKRDLEVRNAFMLAKSSAALRLKTCREAEAANFAKKSDLLMDLAKKIVTLIEEVNQKLKEKKSYITKPLENAKVKLGLMLGNHELRIFNPKIAYQLLSEVETEGTSFAREANTCKLHCMLADESIENGIEATKSSVDASTEASSISKTVQGLDEEDDTSPQTKDRAELTESNRDKRLKQMLLYAFEGRTLEMLPIGTLLHQYIYGKKAILSRLRVRDIKELNTKAFFALAENCKDEFAAQLESHATQINTLEKEKEALLQKLEAERSLANAQVAALRLEIEALKRGDGKKSDHDEDTEKRGDRKKSDHDEGADQRNAILLINPKTKGEVRKFL